MFEHQKEGTSTSSSRIIQTSSVHWINFHKKKKKDWFIHKSDIAASVMYMSRRARTKRFLVNKKKHFCVISLESLSGMDHFYDGLWCFWFWSHEELDWFRGNLWTVLWTESNYSLTTSDSKERFILNLIHPCIMEFLVTTFWIAWNAHSFNCMEKRALIGLIIPLFTQGSFRDSFGIKFWWRRCRLNDITSQIAFNNNQSF